MYRIYYIFILLLLACSNDDVQKGQSVEKTNTVQVDSSELQVSKDTLDSIITDKLEIPQAIVIDTLEQRLIDAGLVNIQSVDSSIVVRLAYTTNNNFIGRDVYGGLENAYLQEDVALKLAKAQSYLKERDSSLSLVVYDAVRPRSVQQVMWDVLDMPINQKVKFVSNPKFGSIHNFGAAVDLSIVDGEGVALDMGAGFDDPSINAWPVKEQELLAKGDITQAHIDNRRLLRSVMGRAGFFNIQTEWWHFNSCTRDSARQKYKIVE